jgi:hypothetical protein
MPFFRCFFVDKSITPYFRRISSPTISKSPPNGVRSKIRHRMPDSRFSR